MYPSGPAFEAHARRILNQRSFAEDDHLEKERLSANGNGVVEEDDADAELGNEQEDRDLLELDPKQWKVRRDSRWTTLAELTLHRNRSQDQDHYAVLGLQHLRYKATEEQIKKARESELWQFCSALG